MSSATHNPLPYARQCIDDNDIAAVVEVLRSDFLTTGPKVEEFEQAVAHFVGAQHAVAVSSGTAALHAAMFALGIGPGDEVIVPPMTFVATANCVVYQGGTPVFADVDADTLLIDPNCVEAAISPRTRAVIAVDYAGQPCDYDALRAITGRHGLALVADSCHSLGAKYQGRSIGSVADVTCFSFHPVKHITTGEGGMATTGDFELAERMRRFRSHGISADHRLRAKTRTWHYEMRDLGFNYRLTDIQCALGISQLQKLPGWLLRRREIAEAYDQRLAGIPDIEPLGRREDADHAYHLYVTQAKARDEVFLRLREAGVGVSVHYPPVHLHPFYTQTFGTCGGMCPTAEAAGRHVITLPLFPHMTTDELMRVVDASAVRLDGCGSGGTG